ncbi:hypothetical protein B0I35DRAFT_16313 [Stachybotrys elegans]|uniref:Uncharacterized protein n=1 Tax=Stachybotrys elegans TaxID=80388 RepID=A0A8K0T749_9HYPO|nr:hypothetical protein B0I35DRAFT_16313 [Stachybotrys elegans]
MYKPMHPFIHPVESKCEARQLPCRGSPFPLASFPWGKRRHLDKAIGHTPPTKTQNTPPSVLLEQPRLPSNNNSNNNNSLHAARSIPEFPAVRYLSVNAIGRYLGRYMKQAHLGNWGGRQKAEGVLKRYLAHSAILGGAAGSSGRSCQGPPTIFSPLPFPIIPRIALSPHSLYRQTLALPKPSNPPNPPQPAKSRTSKPSLIKALFPGLCFFHLYPSFSPTHTSSSFFPHYQFGYCNPSARVVSFFYIYNNLPSQDIHPSPTAIDSTHKHHHSHHVGLLLRR